MLLASWLCGCTCPFLLAGFHLLCSLPWVLGLSHKKDFDNRFVSSCFQAGVWEAEKRANCRRQTGTKHASGPVRGAWQKLTAAFLTRQWELSFPLLSQGQMQQPNWQGLKFPATHASSQRIKM